MVINLESGRTVWVARGKGAAALAPFWPLLRQAGAKKTRAVGCDLAAAYWRAMAEQLPKAAGSWHQAPLAEIMTCPRAGWRHRLCRGDPGSEPARAGREQATSGPVKTLAGARPRSPVPTGCREFPASGLAAPEADGFGPTHV